MGQDHLQPLYCSILRIITLWLKHQQAHKQWKTWEAKYQRFFTDEAIWRLEQLFLTRGGETFSIWIDNVWKLSKGFMHYIQNINMDVYSNCIYNTCCFMSFQIDKTTCFGVSIGKLITTTITVTCSIQHCKVWIFETFKYNDTNQTWCLLDVFKRKSIYI